MEWIINKKIEKGFQKRLLTLNDNVDQNKLVYYLKRDKIFN